MQLPTPFRAALGVVAIARDVVQNFPDKAIELPMLAVSTALQMSLRAQQRYAELAAKGDALLAGRSIGDEAPAWARFDDPVDDAPGPARAASVLEVRRRRRRLDPTPPPPWPVSKPPPNDRFPSASSRSRSASGSPSWARCGSRVRSPS